MWYLLVVMYFAANASKAQMIFAVYSNVAVRAMTISNTDSQAWGYAHSITSLIEMLSAARELSVAVEWLIVAYHFTGFKVIERLIDASRCTYASQQNAR